AAASRSLVLVLPTLPVIAITGTSSRRRTQPARSISAGAVSATSTAVPPTVPRLVRYAAAPPASAASTKSCASRSATIGTNSCPAASVRESNDAPSTSTSGPRRTPPVASATWDASNLTAANGTVGSVPTERIHHERVHLVVLFGGQSAEHEVSCTTAAHVVAAADPDRYRLTPIGISTEGEWALATAALDAIAERRALPSRLDPSGTGVSPSLALGQAADVPEPT